MNEKKIDKEKKEENPKLEWIKKKNLGGFKELKPLFGNLIL